MLRNKYVVRAVVLGILVAGVITALAGKLYKDSLQKYSSANIDIICAAPDEVYPLEMFQQSVLALRYNDCIDEQTIFTVSWIGDDDEYTNALAKLMVLEYIRIASLTGENLVGELMLEENNNGEEHTRIWVMTEVEPQDEQGEN